MISTQDILSHLEEYYSPYPPLVEDICNILQDTKTQIEIPVKNTMRITYHNYYPIVDWKFFSYHSFEHKISAYVHFFLYNQSDSTIYPNVHFKKHLIIDNEIQDVPHMVEIPAFMEFLKTYSSELTSKSEFFQDYLLL